MEQGVAGGVLQDAIEIDSPFSGHCRRGPANGGRGVSQMAQSEIAHRAAFAQGVHMDIEKIGNEATEEANVSLGTSVIVEDVRILVCSTGRDSGVEPHDILASIVAHPNHKNRIEEAV